MTFANERIQNNVEQNARALFEAKATRTSRFLFEPEAVVAELQQKIVGQDHIISAMSDMLFLLKADFADANRPLSVNLFLGPTGVGKTETVKVLSKALLGSEKAICRIDMNTLAQEHYAAALTGAPPGYVGSKEGHTLFNTEAIEGSFSRPGIVLFDEVEKASTKVIRSILNILDTGKLKMAGGTKEIDFTNSLIFMTSNVGAREQAVYLKRAASFWWKWLPRYTQAAGKKVGESALKKAFDPEFINRIERVLPFNALSANYLDAIIAIEQKKLNRRLQPKGVSVSIDASAKAQLATSYSMEYGARNLAQMIRTKIEPLLAKAMLKWVDSAAFEVSANGHGYIVEAVTGNN